MQERWGGGGGGGGEGCDSHVDGGDFCAEGEGTQEAQMLRG